MRELKFRAYIEENGRKSFEFIDLNATNTDELARFHAVANKLGVIKEQYTGLKDKNGEEIYEGDIVGFKWTKRLYVVTYRRYDASFILENDEWEETIHLSLERDDFEVFGNIHENYELLEEGK